ncbi:MAG: DedA family protein [bacterium]|nr:DedA family protein [bacterium]
MEQFIITIQQNDELIRQWGYVVLFFAAWFEGLNTMIIGGFLASLGKLNPAFLIIIMSLGHMMSGYMWYGLGFYGGYKPLERWGVRMKLSPERLDQATAYFEKHGGKAIVVTKFTVGLTIATLIIAGILKMQLKKFTWYNAAGSCIWSAITVGFGYTFGLSFRLIAQYIESFTRLVVFFFIFLGGALAIWYALRWIFRKQFTRMAAMKE